MLSLVPEQTNSFVFAGLLLWIPASLLLSTTSGNNFPMRPFRQLPTPLQCLSASEHWCSDQFNLNKESENKPRKAPAMFAWKHSSCEAKLMQKKEGGKLRTWCGKLMMREKLISLTISPRNTMARETVNSCINNKQLYSTVLYWILHLSLCRM